MHKKLKNILTLLVALPLVSQAQITANKPSDNARQISAMAVNIYTDKGTPIEAYILDPTDENNPRNTVNNHGWTFVKGEMWINNDQVPIILKDEYKEISFKDIKDNDILVRYENGKVIYSLTACKPPKNSNMCDDKPHPDLFLFVLSKNVKLNKPETTKIYRYIQPVNK